MMSTQLSKFKSVTSIANHILHRPAERLLLEGSLLAILLRAQTNPHVPKLSIDLYTSSVIMSFLMKAKPGSTKKKHSLKGKVVAAPMASTKTASSVQVDSVMNRSFVVVATKKPNSSDNLSNGKSTLPGSPPQRHVLPPTKRRTIAHLATQLQGQISRHSGYVPAHGILMPLFAIPAAAEEERRQNDTVLPIMHHHHHHPPSTKDYSATNRSNTFQNKTPNDIVTVRLLDDSQW